MIQLIRDRFGRKSKEESKSQQFRNWKDLAGRFKNDDKSVKDALEYIAHVGQES